MRTKLLWTEKNENIMLIYNHHTFYSVHRIIIVNIGYIGLNYIYILFTFIIIKKKNVSDKRRKKFLNICLLIILFINL